ncbi:MAG: alpha-2-macroglobulin, partial [bacterium]|nr:alpha-2-macroglobulin [bacterium]
IAGEFYRGNHRGGGRYVNSDKRDRIRALQLMEKALQVSREEVASPELARFYLEFARMIMGYRGYSDAWRLQYLSDLSVLPDFEEGRGHYYNGQAGGAPVNTDNMPVYHTMPENYPVSKSDGQRWRSLLNRAVELDAGLENQVGMNYAKFLHQQLGVQTLSRYGLNFIKDTTDYDNDEAGPFELHTLTEKETIARLATGVKRFNLPGSANFIKIFQKIANNPKTGYGEDALNTLAAIFENRRQYEKAAGYWKESINAFGPGHDNYKKKKIDQIEKNWGRF